MVLFYEADQCSNSQEIRYFKPDETKSGGAYLTTTDKIKKVDEYERMITTTNGTKIPMDDVINLESDIFQFLE